MADIEITCRTCNTVTSVSEFASPEHVRCRACGGKLEKPEQTPHSSRRPRLSLRKDAEAKVAPDGTPEEPEQTGYLATLKPPEKARKTRATALSQIVGAWALFVVLAAATGYLRYGNVLRSDQLATLARFGPLIVAAFYVLTLLKAFQDSVFQGILCLLIPPYALVYLFFINDDFFAKAVFGGILVGIGQDSFLFFHKEVLRIAGAIQAFIARGG